MSGPASGTFDKSKYEGFFDVVFVSARAAHVVSQPFFKKILKTTDNGEKTLVAVESSKFLVPLSKDMRTGFDGKILEYATKSGLKKLDKGNRKIFS